MPFPNASHSIENFLEKFGMDRTGAVVIACCNLVKASVVFSVHLKFPFFKRSVKGRAI